MTLQSDVKIKNISKLTWIYHNRILKILIKSVPDVIKTTSSTFLKTSESEEFIEHKIVLLCCHLVLKPITMRLFPDQLSADNLKATNSISSACIAVL